MRWENKASLISYFLSSTSAKNYRNRIVYVKIIASWRWGVFWDTVYMNLLTSYTLLWTGLHREAKKGAILTMAITLSILGGLQNSFTAAMSSKFPTKWILGYPPHLKYVAALPRKTKKNQKFAILVHVKHVSNVTFYHLFNRCLPNIMKINVKINTMQNSNILLFVRSLSLTNWRNA